MKNDNSNSGLRNMGMTATRLAKNPLGIIALFIVLVYGFASMVTLFSRSLLPDERAPLIYFLICFPVLVLGVFAWLVSCHSSHLYGPGDYRHEDNYIRMQLAAASSLAVATACNQDAGPRETDFNRISDVVRVAASKARSSPDSWRKQILWVDDNQDRNIHERQAFEAFGITFSLARSTDEALTLLQDHKYAIIISDMCRNEGVSAGYVLLDVLRRQGDQTPFFLYSYHWKSDLEEGRKEAIQRGAQGNTNDPKELFLLVAQALMNLKSEGKPQVPVKKIEKEKLMEDKNDRLIDMVAEALEKKDKEYILSKEGQ